ncbi:MAG TPA: glycoside hydrolase family 3 protein [Candidatus Acidoferrum sp.]|nr:glycoside hydrolase family 3 protein [Candidatus Acidoferrum sp.]
MSSAEDIAMRCVFPGFEGTTAPDWVLRAAERGLGGVVLFARNVGDGEKLRSLVGRLHEARPGLLVAIDEEGGDVTRLESRTGSSYPGNLALGAAGDPALTEGVARAIGRDLAAYGIDLDLAPVADVNTDPRNPVIGVRSFGSNPDEVATHTAAWVRGLQGAGVAACAKHFPGHGATSADSHLELPVGEPELRPFEAAIAQGVRAVMSAHIVVPGIDDAPATISPGVMTGLLRGELGFDGLAISDGLDMRGISGERGIASAAVLAVRAGCDALCVGGGPTGPEIVAEIVDALKAGVGVRRLAEAAGRVDALAAWRAAQTSDSPDHPGKSGAEMPVGRDYQGIGLVAARRALNIFGDVRVRDHAVVMRFASPPSIAAGEVPWGMAASLFRRGVEVGKDAEQPGASLVLVVRDLHRHADQRNAVEALLARRPDAIVVEMGVPSCRPRGASSYVVTHGAARVCADAAAEAMRP